MRKKNEIEETHQELWEKVWWFRHTSMANKKMDLPKEAFTNAKRIEEKYGIENLPANEYDLAMTEGKMSALAWALGSEWNESLDT